MIHPTIQGTSVPALGFGTFRLPGDDCREGVEHALGIGYRHIDTAQGYRNEEFVGEGLRRAGVPREDIFLVSKVAPDNFAGDGAATSTLESLRKLGTDYVDLMLLHWPNPDVPLEEPLTSLARLQREGAVRHIGVSNFPPSLVEQAQAVTHLFCNQVEYHPYLSQTALLKQARQHDMLLTAYCPIARGKVLQDPVLRDIGARYGKNPAQVTLRWLVQQERVAAIPKSAHAQRRIDNFDIFDFELDDDEMKAVFALDREERLVDPAIAPDWER
jgi:diketogulonate reductase-like aldo/keto reductase